VAAPVLAPSIGDDGAVPPRRNLLKEAADAGRARAAEVARLLAERQHSTDPAASPVVALLRSHALHGVSPRAAHLLLHTRYHTVPKLEAAAIKW
jgi:hypothetical protein